MKIALGSDHAGYAYKEAIAAWLRERGHEVLDCGAPGPEASDYAHFVIPAAEAVARGEAERAIVLGGSGNGEAIAANKVRGVRCALCWNVETADLSRRHNDANVLSIGERMISLETVFEMLPVWLNAPFEGGRHARRVGQVALYEQGRDWR